MTVKYYQLKMKMFSDNCKIGQNIFIRLIKIELFQQKKICIVQGYFKENITSVNQYRKNIFKQPKTINSKNQDTRKKLVS